MFILGQTKVEEEREFYIRMSIREKWSSRELERQIKSGFFLRAVANPSKVSPVVREMYPLAETVLKDAYALSRSLSSAMVSEYQIQMPDKQLLKAKLHEFYQSLAHVEPEECP